MVTSVMDVLKKRKRLTREEVDRRDRMGVCIVCAGELDPDSDTTEGRFRKCKNCRLSDKVRENLKTVSIAAAEQKLGRNVSYTQDLPLFSREEWGKHGLCSECGWELHNIYRAYGVCPRCRGDYVPKKKNRNIAPACRTCAWAKYAGDGIVSCPSAKGSGPVTKDCMKYKCEKMRRLKK